MKFTTENNPARKGHTNNPLGKSQSIKIRQDYLQKIANEKVKGKKLTFWEAMLMSLMECAIDPENKHYQFAITKLLPQLVGTIEQKKEEPKVTIIQLPDVGASPPMRIEQA